MPEIKLGLIPGYGGTQRLPRLIGEARALKIILTGRTVEADEAERIGVVNRIVEGDLLDAGASFAREMTGYSLPALGLARDAVHRGLALPLKDGLEIEADLSTLAFQTADAVEGMLAFLEKRKPALSRSLSRRPDHRARLKRQGMRDGVASRFERIAATSDAAGIAS